MATIDIELKDGLQIGEVIHKTALLREYTAGDLIDACSAAEKVVYTDQGPVIVASPTRTDMELLCRQIVSIGDYQGPLSMTALRHLSGRDLAELQKAAKALDAGANDAIQKRGRDNGSQGVS